MELLLLLIMLKYYIISPELLDANFQFYRKSLDGSEVMVKSILIPSEYSFVFDNSTAAATHIQNHLSDWEIELSFE